MDLLINANEDISADDIEIIDAKKHAERESRERPSPEKKSKTPRTGSAGSSFGYDRPQMRKVSFSMYPDEYETFMDTINANGYRKTEFLLACVSAAKKKSMDANYKKYIKDHQARRAAERKARLAYQQANTQATVEQ